MKAIGENRLEADETAISALDTCIQCRACEPACPSGVPYGRMIEAAKTDLARDGRVAPRWLRSGLGLLRHHRLLLATRPIMVAAQRLRLTPRRLGITRLAWRNGAPLRSTAKTPDVWIYTGCVMDAWQRFTHRSLADIVERVGLSFGVPGPRGSCCGALHVHAGLHDASVDLARRTMQSMPGNAPIIVDSAGCGAAMKDYGRLLATDEARTFSARVVDAVEWLADIVESDHHGRLAPISTSRPTIVLQDPCHHRHVQKVHGATRRLLGDRSTIVELSDDGMCCGAGGAYSVLHPDLAEQVRARKVAVVRAAVPANVDHVVASANPGCSMFLAAAGLDVRHPIDLFHDSIFRSTDAGDER